MRGHSWYLVGILEKETKSKELTEMYVFARCAHPNKSVSLYRLASLQRVSFSPFTYDDVSAPGRSLIGVTMPRPKRKKSARDLSHIIL